MEIDAVTIVSGLPRSGTSMMMRMLKAGGMQILTDNLRAADEDNPRGYYEFERVKEIEEDTSWLPEARGKAVKMIAALLRHLPPGYEYRVVFMQREMDEVLSSQRRMLVRRGEATDRVSDERMADLFQRHVQQIRDWLKQQSSFCVIYVNYSEVLNHPLEQAQRVNEFLGSLLDTEAMAAAVDPSLYRQRA